MPQLLCICVANDDKLLGKIQELYNKLYKNEFNHSDATKVLRMLTNIMKKSPSSQLKEFGEQKILYCTVKILAIADEDRQRKYQLNPAKSRNNYKIARKYYCDLLKQFIPDRQQQVIDLVITTVHEEKLWQWLDLCHDLITDLMDYTGHIVVHYLLDKTLMEEINPEDATLIMQDLYEALKNHRWPESHDTVMIIERFLELYSNAINAIEDNLQTRTSFLIRGLEVCIRNIILNLSNDYRLLVISRMCSWAVAENSQSSKIVEYASILEYACYTRKPDLLENILTNEIFPLVMQMIASSVALVSLLGNRVLQYLIDRNQNSSQFESPQIFFEGTKYNLTINEVNRKDKQFLKQHREIIHDTFVDCIMKHSSNGLNLKSTYCTLCLMAIEVPCGFTAAALVCLVMNIQDLTLGNTAMKREISCHIHSTVIAVLTLICCIHQAKVLYYYVNQVMMERASWAPHLNPPLKAHYTSAVHHVMWDKPELFFVDWEIRFGLWKCFRLHTEQIIDKII